MKIPQTTGRPNDSVLAPARHAPTRPPRSLDRGDVLCLVTSLAVAAMVTGLAYAHWLGWQP